MIAANPRIKKRLKTLDPIIFPTAIPGSLFIAAMTLVVSSGILVPIAISVRPINVSLTPNIFANNTPLSTRSLLPTVNPINPKEIRDMLANMLLLLRGGLNAVSRAEDATRYKMKIAKMTSSNNPSIMDISPAFFCIFIARKENTSVVKNSKGKTFKTMFF